MRIAVNARLLIHNKLDGIGWYTYEVVRRMVVAHPEVEFLLFFDRPWHPDFELGPNVKPIRLRPQARHPLLFKWWFDVSVKRALAKYKCDLFFSPDGYMSLTTNVPQVAVFHDLNFEHLPEFLPDHITQFYTRSFPRYAAQAEHIITVSEFTREDVIKTYDVNPQKVTAVLNGFNTSYSPISETQAKQVRSAITSGQPYFVFPGSIHPRKNIAGVLKAFELFKTTKSGPHHLVFAGGKMWWTDEMESLWKNHPYRDEIHFAGRLDQADMVRTIGSATAMVYPSHFEGFGLPILEGFAAHIPVITSNVSALPEVAGEAAMLVDPLDPASISSAMIEIVKDPAVANQLIQAGKERLKQFNWDTTATQVWDVIHNKLSKNANQ